MYTLFIILADISPPTVSINAEGDSVAGETFTLVCRIVLPVGLSTEPQINWLSPQGDALISEGGVIVGTQPVIGNPSRLISYVLRFSQLLTSHAGPYTCQATVNSPHQTVQRSVSMTHNVSVASKQVAPAYVDTRSVIAICLCSSTSNPVYQPIDYLGVCW